MECSGKLMLDTALFAQGLPGGGGELCASVADDGGREPEDRNPLTEQGPPYCL